MAEEITGAVVQNLLVPVLAAIAAAIVGLIGYVGAAARRALDAIATKAQASTHAMDVQVLVGAMGRKAIAEVADHRTPAPTAAEIVEYMQRIRPDLLEKMQVQPEGLETMARAAIAAAEVATAAPVVVAPVAAPDVLVDGGNLAVALHRNMTPGG